MAEKDWYLVAYDIRDPKRWREIYKIMRGSGERMQYSVFRCRLTPTQLEALRFELEKVLADEDDLLIIRLAPQSSFIERNTGRRRRWEEPPQRYEIL